MYELSDLYQELILDHNKSPRNRRRLGNPTRSADGHNPLCGDRVTVFLLLKGDRIEDISFEGTGCAISVAAASLMTQALKGKPVSEARTLFERYHDLVTAEGTAPGPAENGDPPLGKLEAFAGVRRFPARVKCATLAWHTMKAALDSRKDLVSTE